MQLKHLPFLFLIVAAVCLAGALTASATPAEADTTEIAASR